MEWEQDKRAQQLVDDNPDGMTLEQVGKIMGITRERVRQIEGNALRKLKEATGENVALAGKFAIAIPDCKRCQTPFVRRGGRDRYCELCESKRRKPARQMTAARQRASVIAMPTTLPLPMPVIQVSQVQRWTPGRMRRRRSSAAA